MLSRRFWIPLTSLVVLVGSLPSQAQDTETMTLQFQAQVGDQPFACGESYPALGMGDTTVMPADFRFYVSNVTLIDSSGDRIPLELEQDGKWQYESVALLDFEDKSGPCGNGTTETRTQVVGQIPAGDYQGLEFQVGVPFDLNHQDATLAPSPLNLTSLWWNWQGGYKFIRIDLETPMAMMDSEITDQSAEAHSSHGDHSDHAVDHGHHGSSDPTADKTAHSESDSHHGSHTHSGHSGFLIHLGSTACEIEGDAQQPTRCNNPNSPIVTLENFNPADDIIIADLRALVAGSNLSMNQPDTPIGCMSSPDDLDCEPILANLGLPFNGSSAGPQSFFRVKD